VFYLDSIFEGFLVTTFADTGPLAVIKMTDMDESTINKLALMGMITTSMGSELPADVPSYRLHGPIPVPSKPEYEAFTMNFFVEAPDSEDKRVALYGRFSSVWLIFHTKRRDECFSVYSEVEEILASEIRKIKHERELKNQEKMKCIFNQLKQISIEEATVFVQEITEKRYPSEFTKPIYFYSVNQEGELVLISQDGSTNLTTYPIILIVNTVLKRIFVLKNKKDLSNRLIFLANRAASTINTQRLKSEFLIRELSEPMENRIIIDQASIFSDKQDTRSD
jgi:hypothetical protein